MLNNSINGTALTIFNSNCMLIKLNFFKIKAIEFGGAIYYYNSLDSNNYLQIKLSLYGSTISKFGKFLYSNSPNLLISN